MPTVILLLVLLLLGLKINCKSRMIAICSEIGKRQNNSTFVCVALPTLLSMKGCPTAIAPNAPSLNKSGKAKPADHVWGLMDVFVIPALMYVGRALAIALPRLLIFPNPQRPKIATASLKAHSKFRPPVFQSRLLTDARVYCIRTAKGLSSSLLLGANSNSNVP